MSLEHWYDLAPCSHHFLLLYPINTHNLHPVTWLHCVNILVIRDDGNGVWGLTLRNILWQFLEFYELFVCELAKVVDYFVAVFSETPFADCRFLDLGILEQYSDIVFTFGTSEWCSLHLGHDVRSPNNDSSEGDEPVDLFSAYGPHNLDLAKPFDSDHELIPFELFLQKLFVLKFLAHVHFFVKSLNHLVKTHDHLCREVNKLKI